MADQGYVFCSDCGAKIPRESKFCMSCGMTITSTSFTATITGQDADDVARVAGEVLDRSSSEGTGKIRILFLSANPDDTTQLRIVEECNIVDSAIQASKFRDRFKLEQKHAVSILELQAHLLRFRPNIVHFSGHGSEKGSLVFENAEGESEEASPRALSSLFKIINQGTSRENMGERIRLVILNACYSQQQAKAIAQYVECVIGISDAIKDKSATNFSASFYRGLGFGESIETAFKLGCNQIGLYGDPDEKIIALKHKPDIDAAKIVLAGQNLRSQDDVRKREERKKNLLEHCNKILEKSRFEEDRYAIRHYIEFDDEYTRFQINYEKDLSEAYPLHEFRRQIVEHLFTGQRTLFVAIVGYVGVRRKIEEKLRPQYLELTAKALDRLFSELPISVSEDSMSRDELSDYVLSFARKKNFKLEYVSSQGGTIQDEKTFAQFARGFTLITTRDEDQNNDTDTNMEAILSRLTAFLHQLRKDFSPYYHAQDEEDEAEKLLDSSFEEFFGGVKVDTASLGGACKYCLKTKFHSEDEVARLSAELSKLYGD